ncbi:BPL-N domain-containing protein [Alienimonas chondri]|nr:BPL-N domain-containing protein [Alienimonas chondri]
MFAATLCLAAFCLAPPGEIEPGPLRIALYTDTGTGGDIDGLAEMLAETPGVVVTRVGALSIRTGVLDDFDLVIHPGGSGSKQGKALREEGREQVREFIREGGGMIGICAGAYLATSDYDWSLHVLDAKVLDRAHWARGKGNVTLAFTRSGRTLLGVPGPEGEIRYAQGPLLAPGGVDDLPDYQELATFKTEVHKDGVPGGVMPGTTAVAAGEFGDGRVVCFSPHPEAREETREMLRKALFWSARRTSSAQYPGDEVARNWTPVRAAEELIHFEAGDLPIILSAPHGGRALVPGVPERTGEAFQPGVGEDTGKYKFVTSRDTRVDQLALLVADGLEQRTGKRPSLVVARFSRKYIDANRPRGAGVEHPLALPAYDLYHQKLDDLIRRQQGRGLLLDIHGQSAEKDSVFRGTRSGVTAGAPYQAGEEVESPGKRPIHLRLADAMKSNGFAMLPEGDGPESRYTGGWIVWDHGAQQEDGIPSIQLEYGTKLRKTTAIQATADATVDAILALNLPGVQAKE